MYSRPIYGGYKKHGGTGAKRPTYRGVPLSEVPLIEVPPHTKHRAFGRSGKKRPTYRGVPLVEIVSHTKHRRFAGAEKSVPLVEVSYLAKSHLSGFDCILLGG